jgi:hypothetical protein
MYAVAVEAAAGALPDVPTATVEQVALAVLRVALPLHETQHADAWKAAHERAVHFEWESVKANERAGVAEKEVQRYRGLDAAAKELLARTVELGTRADNAEAAREDLEDEVERLRTQLAEATALLGYFVDHETGTCRFDHHGACQEHGGSSLRRCDVAVGRELLARVRGGGPDV